MSAAAIPAPLNFPAPHFLQISAADHRRFGRGCVTYLAAFLRFWSQKHGTRFYLSYAALGEELAKYGPRFGRSTIAAALARLRVKNPDFVSTESDGRGLWISLWVSAVQNPGLRLEKSRVGTADIKSSSRARQATEERKKLQEQESLTVLEKPSTKSTQQPANQTATERDPEPKGKKEPENPVPEAVEIWKMAKARAMEFQQGVLAGACQRMRKRFADAEQRGERIENTGAYLYRLAVSIGGKPVSARHAESTGGRADRRDLLYDKRRANIGLEPAREQMEFLDFLRAAEGFRE